VDLENQVAFESLLEAALAKKWRVYAKPPFGRPELVLRYLARYTHRVAISNGRLIALHDGRVTFAWKDYKQHGRSRRMTLDAVHFLRRFLLHLLPKSFVRIRAYGFLANRHRAAKLAQCRWAIAQDATAAAGDSDIHIGSAAADDQLGRCPACQSGRMTYVFLLSPTELALRLATTDTS